MPAILKGWVDRTFAMGRIYGGGKMYANGVFKGKKAMVSITTGGPDPSSYAPGGYQGDIYSTSRPQCSLCPACKLLLSHSVT